MMCSRKEGYLPVVFFECVERMMIYDKKKMVCTSYGSGPWTWL